MSIRTPVSSHLTDSGALLASSSSEPVHPLSSGWWSTQPCSVGVRKACGLRTWTSSMTMIGLSPRKLTLLVWTSRRALLAYSYRQTPAGKCPISPSSWYRTSTSGQNKTLQKLLASDFAVKSSSRFGTRFFLVWCLLTRNIADYLILVEPQPLILSLVLFLHVELPLCLCTHQT